MNKEQDSSSELCGLYDKLEVKRKLSERGAVAVSLGTLTVVGSEYVGNMWLAMAGVLVGVTVALGGGIYTSRQRNQVEYLRGQIDGITMSRRTAALQDPLNP